MSVLEKVTELRNQGRNDAEIIQFLKEQRVSPKEINDALSQSQIKAAVGGMQESMMQPQWAPQQQQEEMMQISQEGMPQIPQEYQQEYSQIPQEQQYYQYSPPATTADTISEIVDSIISEKLSEMKKKILILEEARKSDMAKLISVNERLKKVEDTIFNLQASIIRKIGEYGEGIKSINDEMSMMQDSFSKLVNPMINSLRETSKEKGKKSEDKTSLEDLFKKKKSGK
ncbi:hypothetical protein COV15_02695 [Candidatus Woesearchaeota archaeon CG10_big_fil_rev_8_21_14_0_10_34_12]|nr:MAG: hypothetical protein COV15_02695 [Candidatus Woesearchaeota archaeon CG10_big_fil_rev_8_21_14_0_10_34_12]